jgi:hypothetical protein
MHLQGAKTRTNKPNINKRKEIIMIQKEINEIQNKKTIEKN